MPGSSVATSAHANGGTRGVFGLVRSGKNVLGERNIAFLHGPDHKALRKSFIALFTRKALGVYVGKQDAIIQRHLQVRWRAMQASTRTPGCPGCCCCCCCTSTHAAACMDTFVLKGFGSLRAWTHANGTPMQACKPAVVV